MQDPAGDSVTACIRPLRTALLLGAVVLAVAAAHVSVHLVSSRFGLSSGEMLGLKRFFDMGSEANLPTFVSALLLLLAGGLCALIARRESRRRHKVDWHWWGLALGLVHMSFDEAAMVHEGLVGIAWTRQFGRGEGVLYFSWYKLYVPLVVVVGLLYVPFLLRLRKPYALRFLSAGAVFLCGAIGFEMLESYLASNGIAGRGVSRLFEETAEMLGVVLAVHALLLFLAEDEAGLLLRFQPDGATVHELGPPVPAPLPAAHARR